MIIPNAISNVSDVAIGNIDANATVAAGSSGGASYFAGIVVSAKGAPFELLSVNKSNYLRQLGKPLHPSKGACAEPMRHVADAVEGGAGYVVRVVPTDARFPYLSITKGVAQPAGKAKAKDESEVISAQAPVPDVVTTGSAPYGTPFALPEGADLAIYVADGDPSLTRSITMTKADADRYGAGMFHLTVTEIDELGFENELESVLVSMNPEAMDDLSRPAYIETALENGSRYLRAIVGANAAQLTGFAKTALVGGTNGNMNTITAEQYAKAVTVLRNATAKFTAILALGCYDTTVIASLASLCNEHRIDGFFDVPANLNHAAAKQWAIDLGIDCHRMALYHFPYTAKDVFSGANYAWGLSGVGFVAKAEGVKKVPDVGGWHYSPAGEERGVISRRSVRPLPGLDEPDYEAMYTARINKVAIGTNGQMVIDDAITCRKREDYLRFQHVSSTMDAINRAFYDIARAMKHQPDGITLEGLQSGMTRLLDSFVSSGALVKPRDPEGGDAPYVLTVEQKDIDLWEVRWACCVTGTARRISGQPSLIR